MKSVSALAIAMLCMANSAVAASISVVPFGNIYSLYLDGEGDNGFFNVVTLEITPLGGATFQNPDSGFNGFVPRNAGEPYTYINQRLALDPAAGGLGWVTFGLTTGPPVVSSTAIELAGAKLGEQINTSTQPGGRLFLANVTLPSGVMARADWQLIDAGVARTMSALIFGVPEPSSLALGALSVTGIITKRRRGV